MLHLLFIPAVWKPFYYVQLHLLEERYLQKSENQ